MSLTGDPTTDALVPAATALVWAVRERDAATIERTIAEVREEAGRVGIEGLVILLAAMVPDDLSPSFLLAWLANPNEYVRLRSQGVDAFAAARLCQEQPAKKVA